MFDIILAILILLLGIKLIKDASGCFLRMLGYVLVISFIVTIIRMIV